MSSKGFKILGIVSIIVSLVADLVADYADDQCLDERIDEKLDERGYTRCLESGDDNGQH